MNMDERELEVPCPFLFVLSPLPIVHHDPRVIPDLLIPWKRMVYWYAPGFRTDNGDNLFQAMCQSSINIVHSLNMLGTGLFLRLGPNSHPISSFCADDVATITFRTRRLALLDLGSYVFGVGLPRQIPQSVARSIAAHFVSLTASFIGPLPSPHPPFYPPPECRYADPYDPVTILSVLEAQPADMKTIVAKGSARGVATFAAIARAAVCISRASAALRDAIAPVSFAIPGPVDVTSDIRRADAMHAPSPSPLRCRGCVDVAALRVVGVDVRAEAVRGTINAASFEAPPSAACGACGCWGRGFDIDVAPFTLTSNSSSLSPSLTRPPTSSYSLAVELGLLVTTERVVRLHIAQRALSFVAASYAALTACASVCRGATLAAPHILSLASSTHSLASLDVIPRATLPPAAAGAASQLLSQVAAVGVCAMLFCDNAIVGSSIPDDGSCGEGSGSGVSLSTSVEGLLSARVAAKLLSLSGLPPQSETMRTHSTAAALGSVLTAHRKASAAHSAASPSPPSPRAPQPLNSANPAHSSSSAPHVSASASPHNFNIEASPLPPSPSSPTPNTSYISPSSLLSASVLRVLIETADAEMVWMCRRDAAGIVPRSVKAQVAAALQCARAKRKGQSKGGDGCGVGAGSCASSAAYVTPSCAAAFDGSSADADRLVPVVVGWVRRSPISVAIAVPLWCIAAAASDVHTAFRAVGSAIEAVRGEVTVSCPPPTATLSAAAFANSTCDASPLSLCPRHVAVSYDILSRTIHTNAFPACPPRSLPESPHGRAALVFLTAAVSKLGGLPPTSYHPTPRATALAVSNPLTTAAGLKGHPTRLLMYIPTAQMHVVATRKGNRISGLVVVGTPRSAALPIACGTCAAVLEMAGDSVDALCGPCGVPMLEEGVERV